MDNITQAQRNVNRTIGEDRAYLYGDETRVDPVTLGLAFAAVLLSSFALGFLDGCKNEAKEAGESLAKKMFHYVKDVADGKQGIPKEKIEQEFDEVVGLWGDRTDSETDDDIKAGQVTTEYLLIKANFPQDKAQRYAQNIRDEAIGIILKRRKAG